MAMRKWLAVVLVLVLSVVGAPQLVQAEDSAVPSATLKTDLNSASLEELAALPGIGAARAKAIVEGRPYSSLKDFASRDIVPAATLEKFKGQVTVTKAKPLPKPGSTEASEITPAVAGGKLDLNTASVEELTALPGIGAARAKAIVEGRPYASLKDFAARDIVPAATLDKIKGEVSVSKAKPAKPATTEAATEAAPAAATGKLDLNTASVEELTALPGIGAARAKAIVEGRPYASLKDFAAREIVPAATLDKIKGEVKVSKAKAAAAAAVDEANPPEPTGRIDLNSATAEELEVLPGIGPVRAKAIVEGRPYKSLADFESKGIVATSTIARFKDAIEVVPSGKAASGEGTPGRAAAQKRIRMCGAKWRAEKAANDIPAGQTWPQYWSDCNSALKKRGY